MNNMKKMIAAAITLTAVMSVAGGAFAQDSTNAQTSTQAAEVTKKMAMNREYHQSNFQQDTIQ